MDYSTENVFFNKYPNIIPISQYQCEQTWTIMFKNPINNSIDLESLSQFISHDYFNVNLTLKNSHCITASAIFERDDNIYGHPLSVAWSFKMLKDIENKLGEIDSLEGQKMEQRWSPWRDEK